MGTARLTKRQREFLHSIKPLDDEPLGFWECLPHEVRTARALNAKGLIEFRDGVLPQPGEYFEARRIEATTKAPAPSATMTG